MNDLLLIELIEKHRPKLIVELGTGDGVSAAAMMCVLPKDSALVTINWPNPPSGDNPERYLATWANDPHLRIVYGDTRQQAHLFEDQSIGMLCIDSTHMFECAAEEWIAYRCKLADGAVVVVDDLDHNDMFRFWLALPYSKSKHQGGRVGVFVYDRSK